MKLTNPLTVALFAALFAASLSACPGSSGGTGGVSDSGESSATGGATSGAGGEAGVPGSGGVGVTGGANGDGGAAAGGSPGVGGIAASGGKVGSGGIAGSAGASAGGGASGNGGRSGGGASGRGGAAGATGVGGVAGRASGGATGSNPGGTGGGTVGGQGGSTGAGGGSSATDCTDTSKTTYAFTKRYESGSIAVTDSTKTYYTQTNWWYKFGSQTVKIDGLSMTVGNPSPGTSVPSSDGNPTGFPSIFIGAYSGHETVGSNLPKQVSAIQSVPTIFQTNASTLDTSNFNATYDVWFTASGNKLTSATSNNPGKGGAYLMVWMFKPKDRQPRGGIAGSAGGAVDSPNHAAHAVDGMPGAWDVWIDPSDPACISYVSSEPIDGLAFDLNKFIQDSVTNKYGITSSMYLNLVFGGFEIWSGGDGLALEQFCAAVN